MRLTLAPILLSLAGAACAANRPITTTVQADATAPAPEAFACVRDQLKALGYKQESYDVDEQRVTVRKYDENARRPDTQFRRLVEKIYVDVSPGTSGAVTNMKAEASTFAELTTQRGPTLVQEPTSETTKRDAKTVLDRCSSAGVPAAK
jgi:hypothetical protein